MKQQIALDHLLAMPWAITPSALESMAAIASREHEYAGNLQALEAKLGRPLENTRVTSVRDGVAVIPVDGPLFKRASMFQAISGAVDYAALARDLTVAIESPGVSAIMLQVDSPGGQVEGLADLTAMVRASKKPVHVHTDGTMASAAYWLASAADRITASDTAVIGSVGVMMALKSEEPKAGEKNYRFVSSVSPMKNAGPETEEGAAGLQALVDDLGRVFVDAVADNRGVSADAVVTNFGRGDVMVAAKAADAGMIDGVMTFEAAFAALKQEISSMDYKDLSVAALNENRPDIVAQIKADAVAGVQAVDAEAVKAEAITAERARITGIEALAVPGAESVIASCKADGTSAADAAVLVVKAMQAAQANAGAAVMDNIKKAEGETKDLTANANNDDTKGGDEKQAHDTMAALRAAGVIR